MNIENHVNDAFIDALPDDVYGLCPCGCQKKIKFIKTDEEAEKHYNAFVNKFNNQESKE